MTDDERLLVTLQNRIDEARNRCAKTTVVFTKTLTQCMEIIKRNVPVEPEAEGGGVTWYFVCGECHTAINPCDKYCSECGKRIKWGWQGDGRKGS